MSVTSSAPLNFGFFFQPPNDDNIYHVTCSMISPENLAPWNGDDYDYEFFYSKYHVTCKVLPPSLIIDMLNKEIYGRNFDVNELKRKYPLTLYQKLNLELNLKHSYHYILEESNSDVFFHGNLESINTSSNTSNTTTQTACDRSDFMPHDDLQNTNGAVGVPQLFNYDTQNSYQVNNSDTSI